MLRFIFFLLFSLIFNQLIAQNQETDSLLSASKSTKNDTAQISILNKLAIKYYNSEPEKSIFYATKALKLSKKYNLEKKLIESYSALAAANWAKGDLALSLDFLFKKLERINNGNNYQEIAKTYRHIAMVLSEKGDDSTALEYINLSLTTSKKYHYKTGVADAYNVIANINFKKEQFTIAESYWEKALKIFQNENKELKAASVVHNLAMIYLEKNEYPKALNAFNNLLKVCSKYDNKICIATTLDNIGSVYQKIKDYNTAGFYYKKLLDTAKKYHFLNHKMKAYYVLAEMDTINGDFKSAFENFKNYTIIKDSIFSEEKENKISELQIKYKTEKKEKENLALLKEQRINKLIFVILTIILLFLLSVLFFMWRILKIKQINNKLLSNKNEEITRQQKQILKQNIELKQQEARLKELVTKRTEELYIANKKAKESDELKSSFLSNLSHEIRTPMNAIIGFTDLLTSSELSKNETTKYLEIIQNSSNRLLELINDIIDLSKIEAGRIEIYNKEIKPKELLNGLYSKFSNLKPDKVELIFDNQEDKEELKILSDKNRLEQILSNLIENALKFTEEGSVHFGYRKLENGFIEFYVKDTGIGIPDEKSEIIFDQFRKIEFNNSKLYQGTGLGLSISKKLVVILGGKIRVDRHYKKGAYFIFTIPTKPLK
ncbi:MAG: tetratricopeptide repeat protein [Bacteroidales bacterium]|nr:tetratricopeptide repeat protein [Bacteroidales bacterium]